MSSYMNLPIESFTVFGDNEDSHQADDITSFDQADELLNKLRNEQPETSWFLFAMIGA